MVQTLNETAIYLITIVIQHEMAPNTFYKWLKSFKNQRSMLGNYENMLFWGQFKFRITYQLQILKQIYIVFTVFIILAKNW